MLGQILKAVASLMPSRLLQSSYHLDFGQPIDFNTSINCASIALHHDLRFVFIHRRQVIYLIFTFRCTRRQCSVTRWVSLPVSLCTCGWRQIHTFVYKDLKTACHNDLPERCNYLFSIHYVH